MNVNPYSSRRQDNQIIIANKIDKIYYPIVICFATFYLKFIDAFGQYSLESAL